MTDEELHETKRQAVLLSLQIKKHKQAKGNPLLFEAASAAQMEAECEYKQLHLVIVTEERRRNAERAAKESKK